MLLPEEIKWKSPRNKRPEKKSKLGMKKGLIIAWGKWEQNNYMRILLQFDFNKFEELHEMDDFLKRQIERLVIRELKLDWTLKPNWERGCLDGKHWGEASHLQDLLGDTSGTVPVSGRVAPGKTAGGESAPDREATTHCGALGRPLPLLGLGVLPRWILDRRLWSPKWRWDGGWGGGRGSEHRMRAFLVTSAPWSRSSCILNHIIARIFL